MGSIYGQSCDEIQTSMVDLKIYCQTYLTFQFHIPESDESKPQADKETDALGPEEPPAGKEPKKAEAFAIFVSMTNS